MASHSRFECSRKRKRGKYLVGKRKKRGGRKEKIACGPSFPQFNSISHRSKWAPSFFLSASLPLFIFPLLFSIYTHFPSHFIVLLTHQLPFLWFPSLFIGLNEKREREEERKSKPSLIHSIQCNFYILLSVHSFCTVTKNEREEKLRLGSLQSLQSLREGETKHTYKSYTTFPPLSFNSLHFSLSLSSCSLIQHTVNEHTFQTSTHFSFSILFTISIRLKHFPVWFLFVSLFPPSLLSFLSFSPFFSLFSLSSLCNM